MHHHHPALPMTGITRAVLVLRTAIASSNPIHILIALGGVFSKIDPCKARVKGVKQELKELKARVKGVKHDHQGA